MRRTARKFGASERANELRFARQVDDAAWGRTLSSKQLVQMVTTNAARVLGLQGVLGSLEAGKKADLMVIKGDRCAAYDALLAAIPADVQLVMIGGRVLYGDSGADGLLATAPSLRRARGLARRRAGHRPSSRLGTSDARPTRPKPSTSSGFVCRRAIRKPRAHRPPLRAPATAAVVERCLPLSTGPFPSEKRVEIDRC